MSALSHASWTYTEDFVAEPEVVEEARRRVLAAASGAKHVVEVGTGCGTSGLWLLQGMPDDGVLTTIDSSADHQKVAKAAYARAGYAHQRTRIINGEASQVLSRMTDGAYDLVLIDADKAGYPAYVEHALRLLRPGGLMVIDNMLWDNQVADPAVRDTTTTTLRDLGKELRDRDDVIAALLPVSDGLLVAVRR
jgi:predicted O-methyltransferase YrrM